jgi:hypothetical protein
MGHVANFFISPLALIVRAEICIIAALILSVVVLCAGRWPGPLEGLAILTVWHFRGNVASACRTEGADAQADGVFVQGVLTSNTGRYQQSSQSS